MGQPFVLRRASPSLPVSHSRSTPRRPNSTGTDLGQLVRDGASIFAFIRSEEALELFQEGPTGVEELYRFQRSIDFTVRGMAEPLQVWKRSSATFFLWRSTGDL